MKKFVALILAIALALGCCTAVCADGGAAFADVEAGRWYESYINRAYAEGVINGSGYDESGAPLFKPANTLTYAQFIAIMARKYLPEDIAATEFPEAITNAIGAENTGKWWASAYYASVKNGLLLRDISAADFASKPIPRKEMAFVVYSIADLLGYELRVKDEDIEAVPDFVYAAEGETLNVAETYMIVIAACYKLGIINGVDAAGNFSPNTYVTRAQAAAIYCRAVDAFDGLKRQSEMLDLINGARETAGVQKLEENSLLDEAAQTRAKELIGSFSHTRPDGTSFVTAIDNSGNAFATAGENVAKTTGKSAAPVVEAWEAGDSDGRNLVNEKYDSAGIASVTDGEDVYWVVIFAKKAQ